MIDRISKILLLIPPYSILIAVCYLNGYWGSFHIDIFSYLTASDIALYAISPMLGVGFILLISILLAHLDDVRNTHTGNNISIKELIIYAMTLLFIIFFTLFSWSAFYIITPILFSLIMAFSLAKSGIFDSYIPLLRNRIFVLFVLTLFPFESYGYGVKQAMMIKNGEEYTYISRPIKDLNSNRIDNVRYLGKAGSLFIFYIIGADEVLLMPIEKCDLLCLTYRLNTSNYLLSKYKYYLNDYQK
jgi:hypothetical protein